MASSTTPRDGEKAASPKRISAAFAGLLMVPGLALGSLVLDAKALNSKSFIEGMQSLSRAQQGVASAKSVPSPRLVQHATIDKWEFRPPLLRDEETAGHFYRNRAQAHIEYNSTVQFIFIIGLEGTGHHLMGSIAKKSPAVTWFQHHNQIWEDRAMLLYKSLFNHYGEPGLWNAHCKAKDDAKLRERRVVNRLKRIENHTRIAASQANRTNDWHISFPANTGQKEGSGIGMVSYPNFPGPCRQLNYPDLNLFQNACRKAAVDCFFVYLFRHPLAILSSITRRDFGTNDTQSMQLYTTHQRVISNQLRMYQSKVLGCFGFLSEDPREAFWVEAQRDLWSWENVTHHAETMASIYEPPHHKSVSDDEQLRELLASSTHAPYLKSWWNAHQQALRICRQAVKHS